MCVRVKVVVAGGHLIWAEELGHLAPAGAAGQAGSVRRVRGQRRPHGVLDRRHGFGQGGGLGRLRRNDADGRSSRLLWLETESSRSPRSRQPASVCFEAAIKGQQQTAGGRLRRGSYAVSLRSARLRRSPPRSEVRRSKLTPDQLRKEHWEPVLHGRYTRNDHHLCVCV